MSEQDLIQGNISEVLADVQTSDTRDGFIAGPWELVEATDDGNAIISPPVDSLRAGDTWWTAVIICGDRETQNAVARRMHAANDLLAALKACLEWHVDLANSGDAGFWNPEDDDCVKLARAAIAKAETLT